MNETVGGNSDWKHTTNDGYSESTHPDAERRGMKQSARVKFGMTFNKM